MRRQDIREGKSNMTIKILVAVIAVLILFIAFFFVVRPQFSKMAYNNQVEGANFVYMDILNKVQENGYYAIPVGNETLVLVPYVPEEGTTQQLSNPAQ